MSHRAVATSVCAVRSVPSSNFPPSWLFWIHHCCSTSTHCVLLAASISHPFWYLISSQRSSCQQDWKTGQAPTNKPLPGVFLIKMQWINFFPASAVALHCSHGLNTEKVKKEQQMPDCWCRGAKQSWLLPSIVSKSFTLSYLTSELLEGSKCKFSSLCDLRKVN